MKKLIRGIVEFRKRVLPEYREKFASLALEQKPDTLFIACSDSRVVPNLFADESEAAAIEFSLLSLKVKDIVVCGHSECGAMQALIDGRNKISAPNLRDWLRHGEISLKRTPPKAQELSAVNLLSQKNVLQQMEHLLTYPLVKEAVESNKVKIHGWWFELSTASVYAYDDETDEFKAIDEEEAERILARLG
jgi:carbonic anhydrase